MSVGDLPLVVLLVTHTHALFLQQLLLMRRGRYFLFRWVTSGYLHRLQTRDEVSLLPYVPGSPTFCLGEFTRTPVCCRRLLLIWLILLYLNLALLCLPVIFTGMFSLFSVPLRIRIPQLGSHSLQPTQSHQSDACLNPKEYRCSTWRDRNFINNWTLLILFILFHDC